MNKLVGNKLKTEVNGGREKNQPERVKLGFLTAGLLVSCWGEDLNQKLPITQKTYAISDGGGADLSVTVDLSVGGADLGGPSACKGSGKPIFSSGKLVFCYTEPETNDMNWPQCLVNCKVKGYGYRMITKEDTYYLCMLGGSNPLTQKTSFSVRVGEMLGSAIALNPLNVTFGMYPPFPYNDADFLAYGTDMKPADINMDAGVPAMGWTICDSWKDLDKLTPATYNFSPIAATGSNMSYGMGGAIWTTKIGCMCGKEME